MHNGRLQLVLLLALPLVASCVAPLPRNAPEQVLVPVLYATNRSPGKTVDAGQSYSSDRGAVSFGSTTIALSTRRERASRFADWARWQPRPGRADNRNELLATDPLDRDAFTRRLDAELASSGNHSVMLFVHGFRRDFGIVAVEVAALTYDMNIDAIPMFFSWPSANSVFGYAGDSTSIRWAAADLRDTLIFLLDQPSIDRVHVIAHSLGGNGLLEALDDLSHDENARVDKLGEIVLASPDVDSDLFRRDYLPALRRLGARVTLYATDNDVPLQASHRVNRYQRLGDAKGEIFIADGVETVVFSDVVTFLNSHDAVMEIGDVQADLHYLLDAGLDASERPTLEAVDTEQGRYWRALPLSD